MVSGDVAAWDSLAHINLMFAIEQEFRIEFVGNEMGELANVGELKKLVIARSSTRSTR